MVMHNCSWECWVGHWEVHRALLQEAAITESSRVDQAAGESAALAASSRAMVELPVAKGVKRCAPETGGIM